MASISSTSTPSSVPTPPILAPAIASRQPSLSIKPIAAAPSPISSPISSPRCSVTSREWVIPPRPKPGRKPATDTPPTKRKAQNRAAQRAFRERRAARVGELEEQLKKIEEENERDEEALNNRIEELSSQLEDCTNEVLWWKRRCQTLEDDLNSEKAAKEAAMTELRTATLEKERSKSGDVVGGCGNCSSTRCQCIDDAFSLSNVTQQDNAPNSKRPSSPSQQTSPKRSRSDPEIKPEPEEMEIDFTSRFSMRRRSKNENETSSPRLLFDSCGFCQDGTPCICAEMAADPPTEKNKPQETIKLPSIHNLSHFTPPPSEGDVHPETAISSDNKNNPCAGGPGTCAQCLADPRSTLFCKSLAASRASSTGTGGCCGGKSSQGGCCQSRPSSEAANTNRRSTKTSTASTPAITLTCADAFTTLSRHPNFSRATGELDTWLPRLHTLPNPRDLPSIHSQSLNLNSRPAMEVEAASVMGVLRYFDRRFDD